MDIFNVLTMIGGLALFLYGMHVMGDGLAKTSGGKLEAILEKFTSKTLFAVLLGAGVTAVIQPGGSVKDELTFEYCNEHGIAMVTTGIRHFKH